MKKPNGQNPPGIRTSPRNLTAAKIRLLDHAELVEQFSRLSEKKLPSGKTSITANGGRRMSGGPRASQSDDAANVVAIATTLALSDIPKPLTTWDMYLINGQGFDLKGH